MTPDPLAALDQAFPDGADLGTVRLLAPGERAEPALCPALSPLLLPIAEGGEHDLFALYQPPDPGARGGVVCAVDRDSGVYAPVSASPAGFAAWILLLRGAQAGLNRHAAFAGAELLAESEAAAATLARLYGLEGRLPPRPEADALALAEALVALEPASPWGASLLARHAPSPQAALRRLGPALAAAPFAAGLLEQAAEISLDLDDLPRAVRALWAALARPEPNLQAAPYRIDEPDEEGAELFEPLRAEPAFRFLQEHRRHLTREQRAEAPWAWLLERYGEEGAAPREVGPAEAIQAARKRGLGGDLPGSRWILHLELGERAADPVARPPLLEELALTYALAGREATAARCRVLAAWSGPRA